MFDLVTTVGPRPSNLHLIPQIYPSANQPAVTTADFLLCIASKNIPKTMANFGGPSSPQDVYTSYNACIAAQGGDQAKCRASSDGSGGTVYGALGAPSDDDLRPAPFPHISMDCRHVAEAANAMFANCGNLRDGSGAPLMGGVQPIAAEGMAAGLPTAATLSDTRRRHALDASPPSAPASGLFVVIKHS